MAEWVQTEFGPIRDMGAHPVYGHTWLLECPCGCYELLAPEQFEGRTSVDHGRVCKVGGTYHETHDYRVAYERVYGAEDE